MALYQEALSLSSSPLTQQGFDINELSPRASEGQLDIVSGLDACDGALRKHSNKVLVSACGRTIGVDMKYGTSLPDLQNALQNILVMEGQLFQFFDVTGIELQTDTQLTEAVSRGQTPLCATLTDASIHFIENRREELAQMQWKLVRDHMSGTTGKIAANSRQVAEFTAQFDSYKIQNNKNVENMKNEILRAVELEREVSKSETQQLAERVTAIAQLVSGERNKREAYGAQTEKALQGIRDMFDNERTSRCNDVEIQTSSLQEMKALVESEKTLRMAFEEKHSLDVRKLTERIETATKHFAELLQDQVQAFRKSVTECNDMLQQQSRTVLSMRADNEQRFTQSTTQLRDFDMRCLALETRLSEAASRQAATLERVVTRHEKVAQGLETIRLAQNEQIPDVYDKLKSLEDTMHFKDEEARAMLHKEQQSREDQVQRSQLSMLNEHAKQINELELKLAERLELESAVREDNVREVFQEFAKRKLKKSAVVPMNGQSPSSPRNAPPLSPGLTYSGVGEPVVATFLNSASATSSTGALGGYSTPVQSMIGRSASPISREDRMANVLKLNQQLASGMSVNAPGASTPRQTVAARQLNSNSSLPIPGTMVTTASLNTVISDEPFPISNLSALGSSKALTGASTPASPASSVLHNPYAQFVRQVPAPMNAAGINISPLSPRLSLSASARGSAAVRTSSQGLMYPQAAGQPQQVREGFPVRQASVGLVQRQLGEYP